MRRWILRIALPCAVAASAAAGGQDWTGWGGPNRNFIVDPAPLLEKWPGDGPRQLWKLEVGGGYGAVVVSDGVAYVMGRDGDDELVIAVDARTGERKWDYRYAAPVRDEGDREYDKRFSHAPSSTPLALDDRIVTIGFTGHMHGFDKSGKVVWKYDLAKDFGGSFLAFGYASSPLLYKDTVIALVGGKDHALVAFDPKDGRVKWHRHDYDISYCSPQIAKIDGRDVLITQVLNHVLACDPNDGRLLWSAPRECQWRHNAAMPVLCPENGLFVGTPGRDRGAAFFALRWEGDELKGEEVWRSKFIQVHQNAVCLGDLILSSRDKPATVLALDRKTGEIAWQDRAFAHSNFVKVGDHLVSLAENGALRLCRLKEEGVEVLASADLLGDRSWAPPTVVGTRVYIRDTKEVRALELGAAATAAR
jgi:outer membrane protein assembly factor BamB